MAIQSKLKVLILGSCVSRDIFNHGGAHGEFELVAYYARSSLASLALQPLDVEVHLKKIESAFQRQMVTQDIKKLFLAEIDDLSFDLLLIDLIDERFDLYVTKDGTGCTISNEFLGTEFDCSAGRGSIVRSGSGEFFALWEAGWSFLVEKFRATGVLNKVCVNKVYWSRETATGEAFGAMFSESRIANANCLLDKMYRRMSRDFGAEQFMQFPKELMRGAVNHRWGISPFHYVGDYYLAAQEMLSSVKKPSNSHGGGFCGDETLPSSSPARWCDYERWGKPVFTYPSLDAALQTGFPSDGIYRILMGAESIDLLMQGSEILRAGKRPQPLLVAFSGAIPSRNGQRAPFFSGLGLSEALNLPLLAISDPTLARSGDLSLAWYVGNDLLPNLPDLISEIVDSVAGTFGCSALLIGGSGGGFAVLSVLPRLRLRAIGVVWNPQTSIGEYVASAVANYLRTAFPRSANENGLNGGVSGELQRSAIQAIFAEAGIDHDLTGRNDGGKGELLYLQNRGDWHVVKHAGPYLRGENWERLSAHSFRQKRGKNACWFGKWGAGHAAPPRAMLENILVALAGGSSANQVAALLDDKEGAADPLLWFDVDGAPPLSASAEWREGQVLARCELGASKTGYAPEYAFYLLADGQRVDTRWYSKEVCAGFSYAGDGENLDIVAFIRDSFGNVRSVRAPVSPRPAPSVPEESIQLRGDGADPGGHEIRPAATFPDSEAHDAKVYWSSLDAASHVTYTKRQEWSEGLAKELARHSPASVFEFGCNVGKNLLAIRDAMPNTLLAGVDVNSAAVALASGFGLNVQVGDEFSLNLLTDGAFDIAFTVSVLDHLPHPDLALKELARISRKAVYLLEPWLGNEGKVVRNYNRALAREIETTPYSYSWDYPELVKRTLPNWNCVSRPMPLPTNLGVFYFLFELVPAA